MGNCLLHGSLSALTVKTCSPSNWRQSDLDFLRYPSMGDCLRYPFMGGRQVPIYGVKGTKRKARGSQMSLWNVSGTRLWGEIGSFSGFRSPKPHIRVPLAHAWQLSCRLTSQIGRNAPFIGPLSVSGRPHHESLALEPCRA